MHCYYWSQDDATGWRNLGDWLTAPILRTFGYTPLAPDPERPCLYACGSILHPLHYERSPASRLVVWGAGVGAIDPMPQTTQVKAVRGPITRDVLRLPLTTVLGDPALLAPLIPNIPASPTAGESLYVGHCSTTPVVPPGFDAAVTTGGQECDMLALLGRIKGAGFVGSESLHGMILAAAFGVPWAPVSVQGYDLEPISKWNDWFESCRLPTQKRFLFPHVHVARAWWNRNGRFIRLPDARRLKDSFPHEIGVP